MSEGDLNSGNGVVRRFRPVRGRIADERPLLAERLAAPPAGASDAASLGRLRVPDACVRHPDRRAILIDAVPDPPAGGDLELPLFHFDIVDEPRSERPFQRVLAGVSLGWVSCDLIPRRTCVGRRGRANLLAALNRIARREREVQPPAAGGGATRFLGFGTRPQPAGAGSTSPSAVIARLSLRAMRGSACSSAFTFHSRSNWPTGA